MFSLWFCFELVWQNSNLLNLHVISFFALHDYCEYALLRIFFKKGAFLTIPSMPVSLSQYRGEIGSFFNRSTSQISEFTISLFNISVNFNESVLTYIIFIVNMIFLMLLDQFWFCNIIFLWNFLTSFWKILQKSLVYLCYVEMLNRIQVQELISICHWNFNSIAAHNFHIIRQWQFAETRLRIQIKNEVLFAYITKIFSQ